MGLFGNMFEKKQCAICGKDIGLLGNRKLADGNMCKDCAAKLSPYFSDRRESTIADIQRQLAYRAENETKLASFNPTKIVGLNTKAYIDEAQGAFVISRYSDFRRGNPDIIPLSTVTAVDLNVDEHKSEIYKEDSDGKRVSYEPRRYSYSYTFRNVIHVRNEWFDDIRFDVDDGETEVTMKAGKEYRFLEHAGKEMQAALMPNVYTVEDLPEETPEEEIPEGKWKCECGALNDDAAKFCSTCGKPKPEEVKTWTCECGHVNAEDAKFCSACGKPKVTKWYCPQCGKENEGQFCPACGTKKPEDLETKKIVPGVIKAGIKGFEK